MVGVRLHGVEEFASALCTEKMRKVQINRLRVAVGARFQICAIVGRKFGRHHGCGFGIRAQIQYPTAHARVCHRKAPITILGNLARCPI